MITAHFIQSELRLSPGDEVTKRHGAYLLIQRESAVAVVHEGACFLPGGGIKSGESLRDCARREALEELDFPIEPGEMLGRATWTFIPREAAVPICKVQTFFSADDHPLLKCEWLALNAIDELYEPSQRWAVSRFCLTR